MSLLSLKSGKCSDSAMHCSALRFHAAYAVWPGAKPGCRLRNSGVHRLPEEYTLRDRPTKFGMTLNITSNGYFNGECCNLNSLYFDRDG